MPINNAAASRAGERRCQLHEGHSAVEGLGEVGDQVVGVLDADSVADEVVLDADLEPLLAGTSKKLMMAGCSMRLSTPPNETAR